MPDLSIRLAGMADRPVVERLWPMFRRDLAEFGGPPPSADGTFRGDWLHLAFSGSGWAPYLLTLEDSPAGFAFVRGLTAPTRVLNSFFVVHGARRKGIGLHAAREVVARHPGPWEIAFQDANTAAVHFWRRVATEVADDAWTEERRPVPARPDVPPDVWISFDTSSSAHD
ncbi:GNAT family N-acetyltransferase [Streptomyces spongiicola]|uniref:GNAT family N-acetyltransferase n=1 Tax=Streptomyces spongiicola TaxID=1690221 RepID=A0A388ST67_9ACTN|nr:GNAT family N-acetyltransferase [Streptomyces spongiicola]GBP99313.1 GNAT family N-acetyltransferase [Streptomyces spongiicola]